MKRLTILLLLTGFATAAFGASEVAKYEFSTTLASTDTDPTSVAGLFGNVGFQSSSLNLTNGNPLPSIQDTADDITNSGNNPPTAGPNNASTDYFTFTVTPATGVSLAYSTLSFDVATLTTGTTNNSFVISLQTSLNSFVNLGSTTITGSTTFQNVSWNLSSSQQSAAPTDFHLVIRDNTASTTNGIVIDNVILTANVAVIPEPSSCVLVGIGLLIGAHRLRQRR